MIHKHREAVIKRYEKNLKKRLKNVDFSIICSNCIGGCIYHRLGKEFLSPTINLWFRQKDFLKFIQRLDYYLNLELEFVNSERGYPVGKLNDIFIYFLHYSSEKEAEQAWERRKNRINFENIFIIMYDCDGLTEEDYNTFNSVKCKNKILLTERDELRYTFFKKIVKKKDDDYLDRDEYGFMTFERQWDFVEWLNV